jgi:hypothetical protein
MSRSLLSAVRCQAWNLVGFLLCAAVGPATAEQRPSAADGRVASSVQADVATLLSLHPVSLTVTKQPSPSVEKMTSRDQGPTTIIYWPTATSRGGVRLVIDHCLRFGQDCGQPAANAVCRKLTPHRATATKFVTAKPRGGATVVLGAGSEACWDKACTGFSEVHCAAAAAAAPAPAPQATAAPQPNACKPGYVWREAGPVDLVCVSPQSRQRAAAENAGAPSRVDPRGAYGPATCVAGYVWREAFSGDVVCVAPEVRDLVREENRLGSSRRVGG